MVCDITAVEHQIYDFFLEDAIDQEEAARFILDPETDGIENDISVEGTLRRIKADLTTLARKCCLKDDSAFPRT